MADIAVEKKKGKWRFVSFFFLSFLFFPFWFVCSFLLSLFFFFFFFFFILLLSGNNPNWTLVGSKNATLSNGNLTLTKTGGSRTGWDCNVLGSAAFVSGVHEFSVRLESSSEMMVGVASSQTNPVGSNWGSCGFYLDTSSGALYGQDGTWKVRMQQERRSFLSVAKKKSVLFFFFCVVFLFFPVFVLFHFCYVVRFSSLTFLDMFDLVRYKLNSFVLQREYLRRRCSKKGCIVNVRLDCDKRQLFFGVDGEFLTEPAFVNLPQIPLYPSFDVDSKGSSFTIEHRVHTPNVAKK